MKIKTIEYRERERERERELEKFHVVKVVCRIENLAKK